MKAELRMARYVGAYSGRKVMSGTKGMDIKTGSKEGKSIGTSEAAQMWEQNGRSEVLLELSNSEITKKVITKRHPHPKLLVS